MSNRKWGESFLKSGLPLEHLAAVTFRSAGWHLETRLEYQRQLTESSPWFELDLIARSGEDNKDTELGLLTECKYHDTSRFWMFLPLDETGWQHDDAVLNCGPVQTLQSPHANTLLPLAPLSSLGVVLSEDGTKQDNAIYTAVQQLAQAFVPYGAGGRLFDFNFEVSKESPNPFWVTALVPMIVTNAALFRLKPGIRDLEVIRKASSPADIADRLDWTWCAWSTSFASTMENRRFVDEFMAAHDHRFRVSPLLEKRLLSFVHRPNWIAVVNIDSLGRVAHDLFHAFARVKTKRISTVLRRSLRPRGRERQ